MLRSGFGKEEAWEVLEVAIADTLPGRFSATNIQGGLSNTLSRLLLANT